MDDFKVQALGILRDPIWQAFGAIIAVVALIIAFLQLRQGSSPRSSAARAVANRQPQTAVSSYPRKGNGIAIAAVVAILLVCMAFPASIALLGYAAGLVDQNRPVITDVYTAKGLDAKSRAVELSKEFMVGQSMYITYRVQDAKRGEYIRVAVFIDGSSVDLMGTTRVFDENATYNGSFSYTPLRPGTYAVELYARDETKPSQRVTFIAR